MHITINITWLLWVMQSCQTILITIIPLMTIYSAEMDTDVPVFKNRRNNILCFSISTPLHQDAWKQQCRMVSEIRDQLITLALYWRSFLQLKRGYLLFSKLLRWSPLQIKIYVVMNKQILVEVSKPILWNCHIKKCS